MIERKRIVVVGATGTIGKALSKSLMERGYDVVVFSRNPEAARQIVPGAVEYVAWFPVPGFMLKLFLGEVAAVIIGGRRVVPKKILDAGYQFQYPTLEPALRQLLHRP